MATFEFISSEELLRSLEKDTEELVACMEARAWKAAHVLAGSIIQAMLIDYLCSFWHASEADALKMSFTELLAFCRDLDVLSSRTVDLSASISSYLNFIHPNGRIRLHETATENRARIAQALLEIIVNEIAVRRQITSGATAEQIVAKLQADPSAAAIIHHIIRKTSQHELKRLLLEVAPKTYLELAQTPAAESVPVLRNLQQCFRLGFELAPEELKQQVARRFISVLEEESEFAVRVYETCLFRASDLRYLDENDRNVVKAHFFASLAAEVTPALLEAAAGMGSHLVSDEDTRAFFVPLVMRLLETDREPLRAAILKRFREEYARASETSRRSVLSWLNRLKGFLLQEGRRPAIAALELLQATL